MVRSDKVKINFIRSTIYQTKDGYYLREKFCKFHLT